MNISRYPRLISHPTPHVTVAQLVIISRNHTDFLHTICIHSYTLHGCAGTEGQRPATPSY